MVGTVTVTDTDLISIKDPFTETSDKLAWSVPRTLLGEVSQTYKSILPKICNDVDKDGTRVNVRPSFMSAACHNVVLLLRLRVLPPTDVACGSVCAYKTSSVVTLLARATDRQG